MNRDELRSLIAEEWSCSGVWWQWIILYLLPDASRVNRLWLGGSCLVFDLGSVQISHLTDITDAL